MIGAVLVTLLLAAVFTLGSLDVPIEPRQLARNYRAVFPFEPDHRGAARIWVDPDTKHRAAVAGKGQATTGCAV